MESSSALTSPPNNIKIEIQEDTDSHESVPTKLVGWYRDHTCRVITLSSLSIISVIFCFIALFAGKIDSCEAIGFCMGIIMLFAPSPLHCVR